MTDSEAIKTLEEMKARMVPLGPLLEGKNKDKEAVELAISALEKQNPKPMKCIGLFDEIPVMTCGSCGEIIGGGKAGKLSHYCKYCGQRIDFGGDAE